MAKEGKAKAATPQVPSFWPTLIYLGASLVFFFVYVSTFKSIRP